ncbi:MAG TPA: hemerythrin domain-containing protein [Burkholderiaceae bacterium]|nr:hemerythrin domain-containing protein [Burkholderiaceae bacterium]
MAAKAKTPSRTTTSSTRAANPDEAIAQLTADHARVKRLFKQYEKLAKNGNDASERKELAERICAELTAHSTAEEEIFYPAVREAIEATNLIDEAEVEHASAKELIAQIQDSSPDADDHFDAKVKVLGEYINHHVEEEEGQMFPKVRRASVDTESLGEQIAACKAEILETKEGAPA